MELEIPYPDPLLLGRIEWLAEVRQLVERGTCRRAADLLDRGAQTPAVYADEDAARDRIQRYLFEDLLDKDRWIEASALMWSRGVFEQRPAHVKRIFEVLQEYDLVILLGASGMSKTYSAAAYYSMLYYRDPVNTTIKFGSVSDTNLKGNLWANLRTMQEYALFPHAIVPNENRMRITVSKSRPDCGMAALLFSTAQEAKGKIKGVHPKPFRLEPHPVYGSLTVVGILLDEAQDLPIGVEKDLGSPDSTIDRNLHNMKITLTQNPTDEGKWAVKLAAPPGGWDLEKIDQLKEWDAPSGWHVLRMDGADFENVKYRRTIFPGWLSLEGYSKKLIGGVLPSAGFYIFSRGWPPPGQANEVLVPSSHYEASFGEPMFVGPVRNIGGSDIAFLRARAVLAVGRYGLASGWIDRNGAEHRFGSRTISNQFENRHCAVLDQLIELQSRDNTGVSEEIRRWCESLDIEPNFQTSDSTGVGFATASHMIRFWGAVNCVNYKESPSNLRIMAEDKNGADHQVADKATEMGWVIRRWIDPNVRGFFINPSCQRTEILKIHLTTRTFGYRKNVVLLESKDSFMKHNNNDSPDEGDSVGLMLMGPRLRGLVLPALRDEEVSRTSPTSKSEQPKARTADIPATLSFAVADAPGELTFPGGRELHVPPGMSGSPELF